MTQEGDVPGPVLVRADGKERRNRWHWRPTVVGSLLVALVFLVFAVTGTAESVWLAVRGEEVPGVVVATHLHSRSDSVKVRLDLPGDPVVALLAWSGEPAVGDRLDVRHIAVTNLAIDARTKAPWMELAVGYGAAAWLFLCAWMFGRSEPSSPDLSRDRYRQGPVADSLPPGLRPRKHI